MEKILIGEPLWTYKGKHGSPSVGIHQKKLVGEQIAVEVLFKKENGQRLYDGTFFMDCNKAIGFPLHEFRFGKLVVIPLDEFDYELKGTNERN
jgi:hypothetical protein